MTIRHSAAGAAPKALCYLITEPNITNEVFLRIDVSRLKSCAIDIVHICTKPYLFGSVCARQFLPYVTAVCAPHAKARPAFAMLDFK